MKPDTVSIKEITANRQFSGEYKTIKVYGNTYYYYLSDFNWTDQYSIGTTTTAVDTSLPPGDVKLMEPRQESKKELRKIRCSED